MLSRNQTEALQRALFALGYNPGPPDGVPGPLTANAVKAYQRDRGVIVDGVVGRQTLLRLKIDGFDLGESSLTPWLDVARALQGVREIPGPKHNPTILGWAQRLGAKVLGINVTDDETAWCGLFVAHCLSLSLPAEPLPNVAVRALEWQKFGIKLATPSLGCVVVLARPGGGHVGFYVGEDAGGFVHVLGGNTGNTVKVARMEKPRVVAYRWPLTVPSPTTGRVMLTAAGEISRNEA